MREKVHARENMREKYRPAGTRKEAVQTRRGSSALRLAHIALEVSCAAFLLFFSWLSTRIAVRFFPSVAPVKVTEREIISVFFQSTLLLLKSVNGLALVAFLREKGAQKIPLELPVLAANRALQRAGDLGGAPAGDGSGGSAK